MIVVRRYAHVQGYTDAFIEALYQLTAKQGGGYVPKEKIEALAADIQVIEPLPKLLPRLPPLLPPLPK